MFKTSIWVSRACHCRLLGSVVWGTTGFSCSWGLASSRGHTDAVLSGVFPPFVCFFQVYIIRGLAPWPSGYVRMLHFSGLGFTGSAPGRRPTHCSSSHAVVASHIAELEWFTTRIYNYVLRLWGEKKKEEDWQKMLAQGPIFKTKRTSVNSPLGSQLHTLKNQLQFFFFSSLPQVIFIVLTQNFSSSIILPSTYPQSLFIKV